MKYQQFSEKLMILDKEEEMRRNMMGGPQQNYGNNGQAQNGYDLNEMNR